VNVDLLSQRENIENTKEHLNQLIRQFHSSDKLGEVVEAVGNCSKGYENVCRYSAQVLNKIEANLENNFDSIQEKLSLWKRQTLEIIADCQDISGEEADINGIIENLTKLKNDTNRPREWIQEMVGPFVM